MITTSLGEMEFNTGFKRQAEIEFCNTKYNVTIKVKAYFEEDGITEEQRMALKKFSDNRTEYVNKMTQMVLQYDKEAATRFTPQTLLFEREGECALLCDDAKEPDEGIAICIFPMKEIVSQDDYL